jgi:hypothetical protein
MRCASVICILGRQANLGYWSFALQHIIRFFGVCGVYSDLILNSFRKFLKLSWPHISYWYLPISLVQGHIGDTISTEGIVILVWITSYYSFLHLSLRKVRKSWRESICLSKLRVGCRLD